MFKRFKNSDGFVLIESLSALTIITIALVIILPLIITLYQTHQQKKIEVESYRVLYDYTHDWHDTSSSYTLTRSGQEYTVYFDESTYSMYQNNELIETVELIDYDWEE